MGNLCRDFLKSAIFGFAGSQQPLRWGATPPRVGCRYCSSLQGTRGLNVSSPSRRATSSSHLSPRRRLDTAHHKSPQRRLDFPHHSLNSRSPRRRYDQRDRRDYSPPKDGHRYTDSTRHLGGNIPHQGGNIPHQGGNIPRQRGHIPHQGINIPHSGSSISHTRGDIPRERRLIPPKVDVSAIVHRSLTGK